MRWTGEQVRPETRGPGARPPERPGARGRTRGRAGGVAGGLAAAALVALAAWCGGCGTPAGEIFPPVDPPIVWPAPPEPARISYVGQLVTSADLKPAKSGWQVLGEAMFGKEPTRSMLSPFAVCTDGANRVFVADSELQAVHVLDLETREYKQWPVAEERKLTAPVGVAWDPAGRLFVADSVSRQVLVIDNNGTAVAEWGRGALTRPAGLAFDARAGRLLVADAAAHEVVALSARDGSVLARVGRRGSVPGEFNAPTNLAIDRGGRVWVSDSLNFRVQLFDPDLKFLRAFGRKGDGPGSFSLPKGLAVDSQNHLYVMDAAFEAVQVFDDTGQLLLVFGEEGRGPGQFWLPAGLFIDPTDRVWVPDRYNRRVQVFQYHPESKP